MFNIFNRKSKAEKLHAQYKKLMEESFKLSTTNRKLSDSKVSEAEAVLQQIELLKKNS
ncbi:MULTISPECIES: Lacal_2735 family protein [Aequorivita]|uniref:Lacal_2735 family protein n=2 Tax=Aequorivita TaxID=153265 RepID=A0AB35YN39_9FLAO|nr:Lacal_2735 family protein [Aequorivita sp. Ant34-E75]WGF91618.1 Lacal_2735 family protein [Aequorivita sp. Ant34-E75]